MNNKRYFTQQGLNYWKCCLMSVGLNLGSGTFKDTERKCHIVNLNQMFCEKI